MVLEVDSFLNAQQIIAQAKNWGANLLHPGYGFLSENAQFAKLCEENTIAFVGPTSEQIKILGSKESSKKIAKLCGVPVLASLSSSELKTIKQSEWKSEFEKRGIHSPYLIKASGGGGGRGMRIVENFAVIPETLTRASHEALQAFNDDTVFVERYLQHPRHIEIQIFGDGYGNGVFFGERECSLQRRHQKVIEECPSSVVTQELRNAMGKAALSFVAYTKYRGAGTVEFLLDEKGNFYFLEMNTRLQVEHPVTEMVYGIDLLHMQIDLALGKEWLSNSYTKIKAHGVALEARILAENPRKKFLPTPGKIEEYIEPQGEGIRVDSGVTKGSTILPTFDSMISKLIVHAENREQAIEKMLYALKNYFIFGITTNIPFLISLVSRKEFLFGEESTHFIEEHLSELNDKLIPQKLIDCFESFVNREQLFSNTQKQQHAHVNIFSRQLTHDDLNIEKIPFTSFKNSSGQLEVNIGGEVLKLENPAFYNQLFSHDSISGNEVKSPMAGKVYDVCVESGAKVKKGDLLFIIESMKMQLEVRASQNGIIKDIVVSKGEILMGPNNLATLHTII